MPTEQQKDNEEREGGEPQTRSDGAEDDTSEETREASASTEDGEAGTGDEDEGEAEEAATASGVAPVSTAKKPAARSGSAGARLAAAKAAKAAKKAAKKAQLAAEGAPTDELAMTGGGAPAKAPEEVLKESAIGVAASKAGEWAQANRQIAVGIVGVLIVGALGWVGYSWWHASQAHAAGALLTEAVEIANAEVVREGEERPEPVEGREEERTFATREARAEAALEAYRRVLSEAGGSDAARWARLGEARALFDLGRNEDARGAYETALREAGGDPIVAWRALEGIGFTYEADQQWDQAIEQYQELRSIEDGAYEAPADYHIARMRIAKGERVEATTALRGLVERLREESSEGEPAFPYVMAQAEVRLRELDPGSASSSSPMMIGPEGAPGGSGGLPPGLEGIDPQILEQLRRQLGAGGAGEGAPGEGVPE
ncbi:tetratricopeptide repeat protein [Sandaracinus amylolyticus]|uniref:Putative lipoprotein n=1 Tax=Sandaracinus amylolyticus TaxID=927083 RepID=A0A0F6W3Z5_9BACT|nr:tetratricopeptide repeat protein [Sandaracinus amylolyticus]AKF06906.1 putative lipoprotein [Sandaracinus amylolyticus]